MQNASAETPAKFYVRHEDMLRVGREILIGHDVSPEHADIVAGCLIEADLRGVETHGMVRLPDYVSYVRKGLIKPRPDIRINAPTPVCMCLDGDDGFGFVLAHRAMEEAIRMASVYGIGLAAVKRSSHFGMAANYVLQAQRAGYMSLVFTNASRSMPPWGGREAILGTSPIAAGAPAGEQPPFIFDMSPAVAARGKIRLAIKRGEKIPEGWGLDREGRNTTDPAKVIDGGSVLPLGGPKGYGISMMMDIFSGVFSGSAFAGDVSSVIDDGTKPQNVGHLLIAIKPDLFMPMAEFKARMDFLVSRLKSIPLAEGFDDILVAGERGSRKTAQRMESGLHVSKAELDVLKKDADRLGVRFVDMSPTPITKSAPGAANGT